MHFMLKHTGVTFKVTPVCFSIKCMCYQCTVQNLKFSYRANCAYIHAYKPFSDFESLEKDYFRLYGLNSKPLLLEYCYYFLT